MKMWRSLRLAVAIAGLSGGLLMETQTVLAQPNPAQIEQQIALEDGAMPLEGFAIATPEAILAEINRMRESPAAYAAWLETLRPYYEGAAFYFPGERGMRTVEGVAALDGAISALPLRPPMPPITLAPGLVLATQDHLNELLAHNRFTLSGLDGSTALNRAERHGTLEGGQLNELLHKGLSSAQAVVASLVIDDGNSRRSTQDALLNADITRLGVACGVGVDGKPLCVLDYATQYETRLDSAVAVPAATPAVAAAPNDSDVISAADSSSWSGNLSESQLVLLADELIAETNLLRSNPAAYAEKLIRLRPFYEDTLVRVPGYPVVEVTEGVAALNEAIAVLQNTPSLSSLTASSGMARGADDHAKDLGSKGLTGHYGSDGSDPFVRISRYGLWDHTPGNVAGENITYGQATIAEWHLIQLLVDDNVPNRGHREALLRPRYQRVGSACETHPDFRIVCVMTYASEYQEGR
jgi:uncharacterized protein YkwD